MAKQLGLFDAEQAAVYPHSPAHTSDDTSIAAAEDLKDRVSALRRSVLDIVIEHPCTVHECAALMGLPVPTVQPRFSELRTLGLITDTDDRRVNATSGKKAIVWRVAGRR